MGGMGHVGHYFTMRVAIVFELLRRPWCTWLLQHVVNEMVHLFVGGVPQACHMGLCQKLFRNQQN